MQESGKMVTNVSMPSQISQVASDVLLLGGEDLMKRRVVFADDRAEDVEITCRVRNRNGVVKCLIYRARKSEY